MIVIDQPLKFIVIFENPDDSPPGQVMKQLVLNDISAIIPGTDKTIL